MWQVWKWPWQRWALVLCLGGAFGTGAYVGVKWCVEPNPPDTIEQSIRKFEDAADHHKKRLDDLEQFVRKKKAP
jgi:hypothetical protein